jgi:CRISPR-associated protein Csb1
MSNGTIIDYKKMDAIPRLLMEAELKPLQGDRFQPTGFADLGAARYTLPNGTEMLLVEAAQSVANRMELACWDEKNNDYISALKGLPFIRVNYGSQSITNSVLEAHRINSEYIMNTSFKGLFSQEIKCQKDMPIDWPLLRKTLLKYDIGSLLHGSFLEEIDGRLRITRAISGFIEARDVSVAENGGVKNNFVQPTLKQGEGNVPFHRTEFTAKAITAYFNLDLALLRGYGLDENATKLLIALSLFKVRRFLSTGLRLRTACDLDCIGLTVTRPEGFEIPDEQVLLRECTRLIAACKSDGLFADPAVTVVTWEPSAKKGKAKENDEDNQDEEAAV